SAARVARASRQVRRARDMACLRKARCQRSATGATRWAAPRACSPLCGERHFAGRLQRLLEIGDDVVDMLDADGEAHVVFGHARPQLLCGGQLRVSRCRRMNGEAAGIADIGDVVEHLQRVDELAAGLLAALQFEADEAAEASLQISPGPADELAGLLARMD